MEKPCIVCCIILNKTKDTYKTVPEGKRDNPPRVTSISELQAVHFCTECPQRWHHGHLQQKEKKKESWGRTGIIR